MAHKFSFCQTCETPLDCDFCDKPAALLEPGRMTLQELKAEAKRQGYKLIKDKNPRFERCLCGHNARRRERRKHESVQKPRKMYPVHHLGLAGCLWRQRDADAKL